MKELSTSEEIFAFDVEEAKAYVRSKPTHLLQTRFPESHWRRMDAHVPPIVKGNDGSLFGTEDDPTSSILMQEMHLMENLGNILSTKDTEPADLSTDNLEEGSPRHKRQRDEDESEDVEGRGSGWHKMHILES